MNANFNDAESHFFLILKNATTMTPTKSISKLYKALSSASKDNTLYTKDKWERESGIAISVGEWENVLYCQWSTSSSMSWKEHGWKNIIRYFKTPYQERYKGAYMQCWRQCGSTVANHFHVFWDCPKLKNVQVSLSAVFNVQIPLDFKVLYMGLVPFLECRSEIKLVQLLLVASKKTITRRWLSPAQPTLDDWFGIILEIFRMEKLTYLLRNQKAKFYQIWNNWIQFITPTRADFT